MISEVKILTRTVTSKYMYFLMGISLDARKVNRTSPTSATSQLPANIVDEKRAPASQDHRTGIMWKHVQNQGDRVRMAATPYRFSWSCGEIS